MPKPALTPKPSTADSYWLARKKNPYGKTKRLMALAIALGTGCCNCVLGQAAYAVDQGAGKEEILETLSVVVSMRGTTGIAESLRVIQWLDESGVL